MKRFFALALVPAMMAVFSGPVSAAEEKDPAVLGKHLVEHLGCLYCHGLGGRKGIENPAAKRKYVPAWDEPEFAKRYPIPDGVRYVIQNGRQPERDETVKDKGMPIPMPPWGNRLTKDEVDAIIAYMWSLRTTPISTHEKGGQGRDPVQPEHE